MALAGEDIDNMTNKQSLWAVTSDKGDFLIYSGSADQVDMVEADLSALLNAKEGRGYVLVKLPADVIVSLDKRPLFPAA